INYDLRGHGDSDWAGDGDYTMRALSGDLTALVTAAAPGPALLVGASLGGLASLLVAGNTPERVGALVLVDIVPRLHIPGALRIRDFMLERAEDGFATLEEVADAVAAYMPTRQ